MRESVCASLKNRHGSTRHLLLGLLSMFIVSLLLVKPVDAGGMAWYVMVGYATPVLIEGPFEEMTDCAPEASRMNADQPNWAFHCSERYSLSVDALSAASGPSLYALVYAAKDHDRVLAGPYASLSSCLLEAGTYKSVNGDYNASEDGVDYSRYICRMLSFLRS